MVNKRVAKQEHKSASRFALSATSQKLLMLTLVLNCLALVNELSGWLIAFIFISLFWQTRFYFNQLTQPNRIIKLLVSITGLVLLALSANQLGLLNSMVHLLVFSYLLKPLEINSRKDFYIQVLLGIFVLVTALVFMQSLYFMLMIVAVLLINLMLLMSLFYQVKNNRLIAKHVGLTLLKSLPLTIILFVGFPKIAPFWQMPAAKNAQVGLSDEVKVGDIANLALSNALAFRVEFEQAPPSYQQLYWRTLVLEDFDGSKWYQYKNNNPWRKRIKRELDLSSISDLSTKPLISYQMIVEPSYQNWLFGLTIISDISSEQQKITKNRDFTLTANKKINSVSSYFVTSRLTNQINVPLTNPNRRRNLRLPEQTNQRLKEEGLRLRALYQDDLQLVDAVLSHFNQQNYHYTLNPPLLSQNSLEQFYFDTKSGFCEHYASSFTYLMRAAGIPARMVLGYLGGEYNVRGNYYSVYQRDAHAWSEVWIKGKGWIRIDPTAAVNPERVEKGFSESLQQEQSLLSNDFFSAFNTSQWLNQIRYMLEAVDFQWTKWVVGYSINNQIDILKNIYAVFVSYKKQIAIFITLLILLVLGVITFEQTKRKSKTNKELLLVKKLIALVAKFGIIHSPKLTIDQLALQVATEKPELKKALYAFINTFKKIQYQALTDEEKLKEIIKLNTQYQGLAKQIKAIKN
ncbi:transglutaminaseTgpA domain-containing protein [Thalassotalea piscium]